MRAAKVPASLALFTACLHLIEMRRDFSLFHERLAEASRVRQVSEPKLVASIGLSPRRAIVMSLTGPDSLDLYQVFEIADVLDVSVDWLTGRSNVMEIPEEFEPAPPKRKAGKAP